MTETQSTPRTMIAAVLVTCVVAGAGLAGAYALTKDRIAEQDRIAQEEALKSAVPDASAFEEVTDEDLLSAAQKAAGEVQVDGVFEAFDGQGRRIGWGLQLGSRGYGGYVRLVIGLGESGELTGVSVLSHSETPGLGTKVVESEEFLQRFASLPAGFDASDVKKIDGISGATKSSRAVKNAVAAAGAIYADVLSKGGE